MFRRILGSFAVLLVPMLAQAGITEIKKDFLQETSAISGAPVMTAPAADANYLLCAAWSASSGFDGSVPSPILSWTDENGNTQQTILVMDAPNGCALIRNKANMAPQITVNARIELGYYNFFLFGFGFWPGGKQAQGGITETVNDTFGPLQDSANIGAGDILVAVTAVSGTGTCSWTLGSIAGSGVGLVSLESAGGGIEFSNTSSGCEETVAALNLATPSQGPGPLTDYEYNLLHWTDATYPTLKTVFTAGSSGASVLLAENIAEQPNDGKVDEELNAYLRSGALSCSPISAGAGGNPGSCVSPGLVPSGDSIVFETSNEGGGMGRQWGPSPPYSAEVDVIQF